MNAIMDGGGASLVLINARNACIIYLSTFSNVVNAGFGLAIGADGIGFERLPPSIKLILEFSWICILPTCDLALASLGIYISRT